MGDKVHNIQLQQGKTQPLVLRCETKPIICKQITAIQKVAPVRLTVPNHGFIDGWGGAVTNVRGMTEINAEANNVRPSDYHTITVIDSDTIEFNDINAAGFKDYLSGGYVQVNTPVDLSGYAARLQIRNKKNGANILFSMTTENGLIAIDNALKTVTMFFDAVDFTGITWKTGYYELELYKDVVRGSTTIESVYSPLEGVVSLDTETAK